MINKQGGFLMKNSKYLILEKIGEGSFGQIYKGRSLKKNQMVAIKFEKQEDKSFREITDSMFESFNLGEIDTESNLLNEIRILLQLQNHPGFPRLHAYGYESGYIYMALSYFGENLDEKLKKCFNHFTIQTICKVALQILDLLDHLHSKGIIHRDIKPENIMCGLDKEKEKIYLIDYGLSCSYLNEDKQHTSFNFENGFIGTARYASVYAHKGYGQSRRDDLISLGYCLIYFAKGNLPWQNLKVKEKKERLIKIRELKEKNGYDELTNNMHPIFKTFMQKVFELGYFDKPDYEGLKQIFREALSEKDLNSFHFDWNLLKKKNASDRMKEFLSGHVMNFSSLKLEIDKEERLLMKKSVLVEKDSIQEFSNTSFVCNSIKQTSTIDSKPKEVKKSKKKLYFILLKILIGDSKASDQVFQELANNAVDENAQKILVNNPPKFINKENNKKLEFERCQLKIKSNSNDCMEKKIDDDDGFESRFIRVMSNLEL